MFDCLCALVLLLMHIDDFPTIPRRDLLGSPLGNVNVGSGNEMVSAILDYENRLGLRL